MSDIVKVLRGKYALDYDEKTLDQFCNEAADEIERLRKNFATAEHEMKIADRNRIFFQKEYERWMSIAQEMNAYSVKLEEAIYNYVSTVVGCEGVTFIDGYDAEWAKLICDVWREQHKKMRDKDE